MGKLVIAAFLGYLASQISVDPALLTAAAGALGSTSIDPSSFNTLAICGTAVGVVALILRSVNKVTAGRIEVAKLEKR